jgi:hypothetical protein
LATPQHVTNRACGHKGHATGRDRGREDPIRQRCLSPPFPGSHPGAQLFDFFAFYGRAGQRTSLCRGASATRVRRIRRVTMVISARSSRTTPAHSSAGQPRGSAVGAGPGWAQRRAGAAPIRPAFRRVVVSPAFQVVRFL